MLEFRDLTVTKNNKIIFNNLNFKFEKGEKYQVNGPMATGKTTLFEACVGLARHYNGKIYFRGNEIRFSEYSENNFMSSFGIIFQKPCFISNLNLKLNVEFVAKIKKIDIETYKDILFDFGFEDFWNVRVALLSQTQKKLLSLLMSVCHRPDVLVWDDLMFLKELEELDKLLKYLHTYIPTDTTIISFNATNIDYGFKEMTTLLIKDKRLEVK